MRSGTYTFNALALREGKAVGRWLKLGEYRVNGGGPLEIYDGLPQMAVKTRAIMGGWVVYLIVCNDCMDNYYDARDALLGR